eukprot:9724146-Lingulodinium_polyedra.AAC.1
MLVVSKGRVDLHPGKHRGVPLNQLGHHATSSLGAQGQDNQLGRHATSCLEARGQDDSRQ